MPQINAELYAQNRTNKAASPVVVKIVVAWLAGFATASAVVAVIALLTLGSM